MIKIFLSQSFRNLKKNKVFTLINITGFALGIASVIMIGGWTRHQLAFDKFHANYKNLARITMHDYRGDKEQKIIYVPTAFGPGIKETFPEVKEFARFAEFPQAVFKFEENVFTESGGYYADNSVFKIFSFPLVWGSPDATLTNPFEISISQKMAEKYFGNINPTGNIIDIEGNNFTVTSVFKNLPEESHLQFPFLLSMATLQATNNEFLNWSSMRVHTYLLFNNNTKIHDLEGKINTLISENTTVYDELGIVTKLHEFKDIYLDQSFQQNTRIKSGDKRNIYIFTVVGIAILLLSCFNYINLFITQKQDNNKGIAIHKIAGASWQNIKSKFLIEMLIQVVLSIVIAGFILIVFSSIIAKYIDSDFSVIFRKFGTIGISLLIVFIIFLVAGMILSLILARYSSQFNFRKQIEKTNRKAGIVNKLVAFQYFVSIVLLISTMVVVKQKEFLMNKDLGFDKEQVISIPMTRGLVSNYSVFKEEILKLPEIKNISTRVGDMDEWWDGGNFWTTGMTFNEGVSAERIRVEYDYFQTLNIKLSKGRFFSKEEKTDFNNSCILNKKAVEKIGLKNPLGKEIFFNDERRIVIGVIENILTKSMHEEVYPEIYLLKPEDRYYGTIMLIKISGDIKNTLAKIEQTLKKNDPENPFNYQFLDNSYAALYAKETKLAGLFKLFSFIAMALSCFGILGLTFYSTRSRIKEIGIRKVNGSKISEILIMLNKDFVKWVVISFIVATPVAYYTMNKWLENFAYKTTLSWWIFTLAGLLALGIALLTVSFQSWKAATRNPVEALKYE